MARGLTRRAFAGACAVAAASSIAGCAGSRVAGDGCTGARVIEVEWHYTLPDEDKDKVVVTVSNPAPVGGTVVVEFRYYPRPGRGGEPMTRDSITVRVGADDAVRVTHRLFPPVGGGHRSLGAAVVAQDCPGRARTGDPDARRVTAP